MKISVVQISGKVARALDLVLSAMGDIQSPYQITGGLAANFHGVVRPVNDIDVDVPTDSLAAIAQYFRDYIVFGPDLYVDSEWMVELLLVRLDGQEVEFTSSDCQQLYNEATGKWDVFSYDLSAADCFLWGSKKVNIIPKEQLLRYKKYLHGPHQVSDIAALRAVSANTSSQDASLRE